MRSTHISNRSFQQYQVEEVSLVTSLIRHAHVHENYMRDANDLTNE